jgi:hypothetical protein
MLVPASLALLLLIGLPAASQLALAADHNDASPALITSPIPPDKLPPPHPQPPGHISQKPLFHGRPGSGNGADPVVQTSTPTPAAAQTLGQWEGMGAGYPNFSVTAVPPDPNMEVGPNHIVQWVNNAFVIFDKQGNTLQAPVADSTFWGARSTCYQGGGFSDPIIRYDRAADRWVVGEVALPALAGFLGQYAQCFAVSKTSDPTFTSDANGNNTSYYIWAYGFGTTVNDYDKIAVWSDGYYVTWNIFPNGNTFSGAEACAWSRNDMLNGVAAPAFKCFQLSSAYASLLAADLDGANPPPAGSPEFFMDIDPNSGALNLWTFHADFANTSNSTFTGPTSIPNVAAFTVPCPETPATEQTFQNCLPQPGTTQKLDAIGDRLMYRLAYRNFGDHESLVANHTVLTAGGNTGVRWYEVRNPNGAPTLYQQGTFAPDSDNRWMASIAMDKSGNIGLGYSVTSGVTYPSIRYTGWEVGNTLGNMQAETSMVAGGGSQTGYNRWGDYSAMMTDPTDDCTFWYTQQYQATTQSANWNTRIGSFKFSSCGQALTATTTTLSPSANPSNYAQSVTFTAAVTPSPGPTGNVTFKDGGTVLATVGLVNGQAAYTTSALTGGPHSITAAYGGDATYSGSTSSAVNQTVNKDGTSTALTSNSNPSNYGQSVQFTATVTPPPGTGTPTGTVTFKDGGTTIGSSPLSGGGANYSTSSLSVNSHSITAVYNGDTNFSGSTSAGLNQTVNKASASTALGSSLNPSFYGTTVTFTATLTLSSGTGPTGTVTFKDNGATLATLALSGSTASYSISNLAAGSHPITTVYSGDGNFSGSTSGTVTQTVNQAGTNTLVGSSSNPSIYGASVTFTATVSPKTGTGTPTGNVTFKDGGTLLATVSLSGGTAGYSTSGLSAGGHSITANYNGDSNYTSSTSSAVNQTVNKVATNTAVSSSLNPSTVGTSVTFTATVSPSAATGTVQFFDGGTSLGSQPLSGGTASLTTASLTAGSHPITATYSGDGNYSGSTSGTLTQTVNSVNANFTISATPTTRTVTHGSGTTYTVTIGPTGGFNGSVSLTVSGLPSRATSSFSVNPVTGGSGDSTLTVSTGRRTPTGTYTLTITGTSGGLIQKLQVKLTVN